MDYLDPLVTGALEGADRARYSAWDGTQDVSSFEAGEVLDQLADDLLRAGDPQKALRNLLQRGFSLPDGRRFDGLRRLLQQMRRERESMLDRYDPGRMVDAVREQLDQIIAQERKTIEEKANSSKKQQARPDDSDGTASAPYPSDPESDGTSPGSFDLQGAEAQPPNDEAGPRRTPPLDPDERGNGDLEAMLSRMLARKSKQLDGLPSDNAGRIRGLREYDFMSSEARDAFEALIGSMQRRLLQQYAQGLKDGLGTITSDEMAATRQRVQDLNQMIEASRQGDRQAFDDFMERWGESFPPGIQTLDDLLSYLQRQASQVQALLDSLDDQSREELGDLMRELLRDDRLQLDLARLAANLEASGFPVMPGGFPFQGSDAPGFGESLDMMSRLQTMESLEDALARDPLSALLDAADSPLGESADGSGYFSRRMAGQLQAVKDMVQSLTEEGYLKRGNDRLELTPRAIRHLGDSALREIFQKLKMDRQGGHQTHRRGQGGDISSTSRPYQFGDAFHIDLSSTIMNGVRRGARSPVHLAPSDFEVFETERAVRHATVLAIDTSRSMFLRGLSVEAKKTALALDSLIRSQFPRDVLHIIGFSYAAYELDRDSLPTLAENYMVQGTNYEMALALARRLLARFHGGNRQILFVTDGEPTACADPNGGVYWNYPAPAFVRRAALAEAARCQREGIVINTFMLDSEPALVSFVEHMTAVNRGRAFLTGPYHLGERLVVDYLDKRVTKHF